MNDHRLRSPASFDAARTLRGSAKVHKMPSLIKACVIKANISEMNWWTWKFQVEHTRQAWTSFWTIFHNDCSWKSLLVDVCVLVLIPTIGKCLLEHRVEENHCFGVTICKVFLSSMKTHLHSLSSFLYLSSLNIATLSKRYLGLF